MKGKTQKGITLIALLLTIVVLLILAAVVISSITNDGVLGHAKYAATTYNQAVENEQGMLQEYEGTADGLINGWAEYSVGDEVKVGKESFYVIKATGETEKTVLLLTKECIDTVNLVQSANANEVQFAAREFGDYPYWRDDIEDNGGYDPTTLDIIEPDIIPTSHIAAYAASEYGKKVGGTGRIMKQSERDELKNNAEFSSKLNATGNFWLCTLENGGADWQVTVNDRDNYNVNNDWFYHEGGGMKQVRPVVEISKAKVTLVTE